MRRLLAGSRLNIALLLESLLRLSGKFTSTFVFKFLKKNLKICSGPRLRSATVKLIERRGRGKSVAAPRFSPSLYIINSHSVGELVEPIELPLLNSFNF